MIYKDIFLGLEIYDKKISGKNLISITRTSKMPSINQVSHAIKSIYKTDIYENRVSVLSTYIKLSIRKSFLPKFSIKKRGATKLFGRNFSYLSFSTFYMLYCEIFIDQDYYFYTSSKSPYIIDCGSNIGMSILFFSQLYPNAMIVGFEPDKYAYQCLESNFSNSPNITVYRKAITDKKGTIDFFVDPQNIDKLNMSLDSNRQSASKISVEADTLSSYINKDVDFLKIDIEGAELSVFEELNRANKLQFIRKMSIEFHHHINKKNDDLSVLLKILEENNFGYQIKAVYTPPFIEETYQDLIIFAYKK